MKFTSERLKEPSTWAGIAGLAVLLGANVDQAQAVAHALAGVAGVVAVFMPEKKS